MNTPINYKEEFEQTLKEIDQFVNQKVESISKESFDLPKSFLFAVDYVHGEVPAIRKIAENRDVYDMLDDMMNAILVWESGYNGFAIVTTGWAAPIDKYNDDNNDVAPSQHPERRRCRVMTMMHNSKMGSSLRFIGDKTVTYDEGNAMGTLASGMRDFNDIVKAMQKSASKQNERQLP